MANMTDAHEREYLDGITGVTQYTTPATTYLALFTADPTDTGSVTNELSGSGYARVSLSGKFSAATGTDGTTSNTSEIAFPTATADWPEVTHAGIMKSGTAATDDMIIVVPLDAGITIYSGDTFKFAIGKLTITAA